MIQIKITNKKTRIISSIVFGVFIYLFLTEFIPIASCIDGWLSPSIGKQGACSSHGGVADYKGWYQLSFLFSVVVGWLVCKKLKG